MHKYRLSKRALKTIENISKSQDNLKRVYRNLDIGITKPKRRSSA